MKYKSFISFIIIIVMLFLGIYISYAESDSDKLKLAQERSYRRLFPEQDSPKPEIIQARDAREQAEAELKKEKQEKALAEAETRKEGYKRGPSSISGEPTKIYYQIQINDRLYISVWRVPDLSMEFIVGPDAKISFPLIGDIDAAGKTLSELDAELTNKLKEYVIDPQVSVVIREFAGDRVTVIGEVTRPGVYKVIGEVKMLDVIALAGGFTDRAKITSVVVAREPADLNKKSDMIVVDAKSIFKGNIQNNIKIQPYDIVYVSRTFVSNAQEFYDQWITPVIQTMVDSETFQTLRLDRRAKR